MESLKIHLAKHSRKISFHFSSNRPEQGGWCSQGPAEGRKGGKGILEARGHRTVSYRSPALAREQSFFITPGGLRDAPPELFVLALTLGQKSARFEETASNVGAMPGNSNIPRI